MATGKTFRGTHQGVLRGPAPTGNRVAWEFLDLFRVRDGRLLEHWTSLDLEALRAQLRVPGNGAPVRCGQPGSSRV